MASISYAALRQAQDAAQEASFITQQPIQYKEKREVRVGTNVTNISDVCMILGITIFGVNLETRFLSPLRARVSFQDMAF